MDQKYNDQIDDNDSICPYCGERYQVENEDFSEDEREITCDSCEKKYWQSQIITVETQTRPDCELNNDKHEYEFIVTKSGGAFFCKICGKCSLTGED
jgi:hypothetical protein